MAERWMAMDHAAITFPMLAAISVGWATATAEPLRIDGSVEGRFSDNTELTSTDETSDIENRVSLGLGYRSDPGRCNADLSSRFGYGYWVDDTYDPEVYSNMTFFGDCEINEYVSWELTDYLRDVNEDSRAGDTPENRTRKNIFRTGPVLTFRPSPVDLLEFRASYEQTNYSEPVEPDSERYVASVAWDHLFSPSLTAGFLASADRAELDAVGEEIDRDTVSATFSKQWVATRLSGSLGVSRLESRRPSSESEYDGVVGNLSLAREINPTTTLTMTATRELTDQTTDLDIRIGSFVFNLEQTEPVEVTALRATLDKSFSDGSTLDITGYGSRTDFLLSDLTDYRAGLNSAYRRPLTEFLGLNAGLGYDFFDYGGEIDSNDHVVDVMVGLDYQLSRKLTAQGSIGHERRESETASREYEENWILLGLSYQFR